ncbi:MAG: tetratricopeptide repeat-containing sulfotransferase family protein, partial [Gammaproteobacteria bacterium]
MQQIFQPSAPGDAALKTELDAAADTLAAGNLRDAREAMDSLLTKAPGDYKVLQLAGTLALSENRGKQAADYFRGALSVSRLSLETSRSLHGLGLAFAQMGDFAQASEAFARAVQAHPGNLVSLLKWAEALGALNRNSEAETMLRNALPRFSDDPRISIVLGNILTAQNRQADALHIYDGVIEKYPDSGMAHFNRSIALTMLGRIHEAEQDVMRALELDPAILGYYHLSAIHAFSKEDPWFAKLTERSKMTLDEDARIDIDFALAKAYEDIAEYDRAFKHLEAGNTRKRRMLQFNMGNEEIRANRITSLFTPDFFARFHGKVGCDLRPIFILGMPRSGSTLLEQMLAAHPAITAGGELPYMIDIARDIGATWGSREINFPGSDTEVIGDLQAGADRYASLSASLRESKVHFTDKLPGNFQFIGLIHLMFPDAVIINIKRDP